MQLLNSHFSLSRPLASYFTLLWKIEDPYPGRNAEEGLRLLENHKTCQLDPRKGTYIIANARVLRVSTMPRLAITAQKL